MKTLKKIATMLLIMCLVILFFTISVDAADGNLMFSDPTTKVGENVSVDMVIQSSGETIGDVDVTMSYDTTVLEFVGGNEVTSDGNGTLTYSHKGSGSETELRTTLEFRALKQGEANIAVTGQTAYLYSDETLTLVEGSSVVTIDVGADGSTSVEPLGTEATSGTAEATDVKVNVNGMEYSFSEAFGVMDIPEGFMETMLTYDGTERKFVENDKGIKLGYLVDGNGKANFFLYNEENATFSPFVEIYVSDTTSIVLLSNTENVTLPEQYQNAELQIGDYNFPAWQDMKHDGYYVMYALNVATGQQELYQYDTVDGTYQRLIKPEVVEEKPVVADGFLGKLQNLVNSYFKILLILGIAFLLILIIILIVLSVKLYRRNAELDDLYDEYGIDDDNMSQYKNKGKKKQIPTVETENLDEAWDDEFLDDDSFYDEEDYDDEYLDEDYGDDFYDDLDQSINQNVSQKRGQKKASKSRRSEDVYDVDFIDL